jgi:hypothetical protein
MPRTPRLFALTILRANGLWSVHLDGETMTECAGLADAFAAADQIATSLRTAGHRVDIAPIPPPHL